MFASSQQPVRNISLVYALVYVINHNYGQYSTSPLTIAQFATSKESRGYQNDLIDAVLAQATHNDSKTKFLLKGETVSPAAEPEDPLISEQSSRDHAIWLVDSMPAFRRLERHVLLPSNNYNRNGYFCIVYTGRERARLETIKQIFRRLFELYVINVNVFVVTRGSVQLYTYFPFTPLMCQSAMPVFYASFQGVRNLESFQLEKPFFANKLANMHGCELISVTFEHRPFVILEAQRAHVADEERLLGIEGLVYRTLAEKMNFTIRIVEQLDKDRGLIFENGSATGATQKLIEGLANITFVSYMYSKARSEVLLPSISYMSFPIVLCVPRGRQMSPIQRLAKPFKYIIWSCLSSSIVLGFGLIGTLRLCASPRLQRFVLGAANRMACTHLWSTLLAGIVSHPPRRNFARYLLALWLLYTQVLRNAYSGELYILLQDGRSTTQLDTLEEVVGLDFTFYMLPALEVIFRAMVPDIHIDLIRNGARMEQLLTQLRDDPEAQLAMPLLQPTAVQFDQRSPIGRPRLTVLPDPLMTAPLTLYMRPHSYLKHRINELLMAMMSSGIVRHYRQIYLENAERAASSRTSHQPQILTLWLLGGVFGIYVVMHLLACVVFSLERGAAHRPWLRRLMDGANRYIA